MCGPGNAEKGIAGSEQTFMKTLQQNYNVNFAEQQSVLSNLNNTLQPIISAGPNQTGFSAAEEGALNTQAIDTTGANYKNAAIALNNQLAGRNDSGNAPESGVDQALKERLASSAEGELSQEQLGITEANYATGRSNFEQAIGGEEALAGQYNPTSTGSLANQSSQIAFGQADQIQQEENQEQADIAGGIESVAGAGIGGFNNLDTKGTSTTGEQFQNFFQGAGL